jgi:hypothetical protein
MVTVTNVSATVAGSLSTAGEITSTTSPATSGPVIPFRASTTVTATGALQYTGLLINPGVNLVAGGDVFNGIELLPNLQGPGSASGFQVRGLRGQATCKVAAGDANVGLQALNFEAIVSMNSLTSGTSATISQIAGVESVITPFCSLSTGGVRTLNITTVRGLYARSTVTLAGTGVNICNITNWVGVDADWISTSDADLTVTNFYGVRINAAGTASPRVTNRFGIWEGGTGSAGDNHGNRFKSNTQFGSTTGQFGGGDGVIGVATATTLPVGSAANGVIMFVENLAGVRTLRIRKSDGTTFTAT